jgi:hypothetical protein
MGGMIVLNYGALRHEKDPVDGIIATGKHNVVRYYVTYIFIIN